MTKRVTKRPVAALIVIFTIMAFSPAPAAGATGSKVDWMTVSTAETGRIAHLTEMYPDIFAGVQLDQVDRRLVVFVAGGSSNHERAQTTLSNFVGTHTIASAEDRLMIEIVSAPRSLSQLMIVMRNVTRIQPWARQAGPYLSRWYPDAASGQVVVALTRVDKTLIAAASHAFGNSVRLTVAERSSSMMRIDRVPGNVRTQRYTVQRPIGAEATSGPTRLLDSTPYYGGDRIVRTFSCGANTCIAQCTVSFKYRFSSTLVEMGTAGHCSTTNTSWLQGYYDTATHTIKSTGKMGTVAVSKFSDNTIDAGLISGASYGTYVYNGLQSAFAVRGDSTPVTSEIYCSDGSFTGQNCTARVVAVNACMNVADDSGGTTYICGLAIATSTNSSRLVQSGDSGGPVYNSAASGIAKGIISAGNSSGTEVAFTMANLMGPNFSVTIVHQ